MAPNKRKILETARKYAQKGQKDRALKEYEKLLKLDPRDAKLRLEIGDAYRRWGQVDDAAAAYTKVAEQYMAEGFDARAVAVFKQIQNLDPERYDAYVPLAELYERMGLTSEAIQALQTAADGLHKEGKKREALELLRRMAALDPSNTTSRIKVADLLHQEGLTDEAITEYEAARAELEKQGEHEAAGSVLERVHEADPERLDTLVALARNLLKRGQSDAAEPMARKALEKDSEEPDHYELLADVYRAQQRDGELKDTYKRLADLYRARGDDDRARDIIQRFVPMDEFGAGLSNPNLEASDGLDAGLVGGTGSLDLSESIEAGGDDILDEEILMDEPVGVAGDEPLGEEPVLELTDESEPEMSADGDEILLESPPAAAPDDSIPPPPVEGDPEQLLAEASVYLRYGKRGQAIRNLEAVVERVPDHRAALEKLGEAYAEDDDAAQAVAAWLRAADLAGDQGDREGLSVLRDRIAALDPDAAAGLVEPEPADAAEPGHDVDELLELSIDPEPEPEEEQQPAPPPPSSSELELDDVELEDDIEIDIEDEDELDESPAEVQVKPAGPGSSASVSQQIQDELEEAEFYQQQGLVDEARAIYQRVLEQAPNHPLALVRMGELEAGDVAAGQPEAQTPAAPEASEGEALLDIDDEPLLEPAGEEPMLEVADEAGSDADIGRDLAEWDADESLGVDIGLEAPEDELAADALPSADAGEPEAPADTAPEVQLDLSDEGDIELSDGAGDDEPGADTTDVDVALAAQQPPPAAPEPIAPPEPIAQPAPVPPPRAEAPPVEAVSVGADDFDLASVLTDALDEGPEASISGISGPQDDGFSAVFREFKKGVSKTLGEGDQEAHWDLGIAYREMGLLEDALGEFEIALTSPERRVAALHMIGVCSLDLGRAADGGTRLEEALASGGLGREESLAIRFDLGRAYEAQGRIDDARSAWEAVAEVDPGFCEVGERLSALGEAKPEAEAEDPGFESFDDLIAEADGDAAPAQPADAGESFDDLIAEANEEPMPQPAAEAHDPGDTVEAPAADPNDSGSGAKKGGRRKKKISFV